MQPTVDQIKTLRLETARIRMESLVRIGVGCDINAAMLVPAQSSEFDLLPGIVQTS